MDLYTKVAFECSKHITRRYSTSFSSGVKLIHRKYRNAIYGIYGFVRYADEIVDEFHQKDKERMLTDFSHEAFKAIENGLSTNPVLHSFQYVVNHNTIPHDLIESFLYSMRLDLTKKRYNKEEYNRYIYGSAEVVGMMCLCVFYNDDKETYHSLKYYARMLGQAFQKVNFLRDIKQDYLGKGRLYFPDIDFENFTEKQKKIIEADIESNFKEAYRGIRMLRKEVQLGVFTAYSYYNKLFQKIKATPAQQLLKNRYRLSNLRKVFIAIHTWLLLKIRARTFSMNKSLNLKVTIDSNSGFCFGVVKAIKMAEEALERYEKVYCLGEIVHNDEETHRLEKKGLITITQNDLKEHFNNPILFRAHGEPPESYQLSEKNRNTIIDASCPIILKLQQRIKKSYDDGEAIFIYGKKNHPEIIGLNGQIDNSAVIFESLDDLKSVDIPKSFTLYSQTTIDKDKLHQIADRLKEKGYTVKLIDTTCKQVSNRKKEIMDFCRQYDKIVFIAGRNSSNGKVLCAHCKNANSNTYFISTPFEIRRSWFSEGDTVGIAGATSTPQWVMEEVREIIGSF
ncbi:MAG: 4-hydroxy-3-methylbut-2-enyl diphosphate reductase [Bacteroidales bacterium]|nr:4-hydroxy-3-methylbut-2-enyl diphosphate reductase [Bacteroidales bacterium]